MTGNYDIFLWCKHRDCDETGIYCTTEGMALMNCPFTETADSWCYAEIEFPTEEAARAFTLPNDPWFAHYREVTGTGFSMASYWRQINHILPTIERRTYVH